MEHSDDDFRQLASYRHCSERIAAQWQPFHARRADRLRHGFEAEKVAEAILEDLFTEVLDWTKGDVIYQHERADIILSQNGMKYLLIEAKRPGSLQPNSRSLENAISQAVGYAEKQEVTRVAASDGRYLIAKDVAENKNASTHRAYLDLTQTRYLLGYGGLASTAFTDHAVRL
jgi:hypothetical protein